MNKKATNKAEKAPLLEDVRKVQTAFEAEHERKRLLSLVKDQSRDILYEVRRFIASVDCPKLRADLENSANGFQEKAEAVLYERISRLNAVSGRSEVLTSCSRDPF